MNGKTARKMRQTAIAFFTDDLKNAGMPFKLFYRRIKRAYKRGRIEGKKWTLSNTLPVNQK